MTKLYLKLLLAYMYLFYIMMAVVPYHNARTMYYNTKSFFYKRHIKKTHKKIRLKLEEQNRMN